jgi:hypothetical protein
MWALFKYLEVSVAWKLRNNVEVCIDPKTEHFVHFSLSWLSLPLISVDNVPLLVDLSVSWSGFNVSVFSVNISLHMNDLSFHIDNE